MVLLVLLVLGEGWERGRGHVVRRGRGRDWRVGVGVGVGGCGVIEKMYHVSYIKTNMVEGIQ